MLDANDLLRSRLCLLIAAFSLFCSCGAEERKDSLVRKLSFKEHASKLPDVPGSYEWWNFFAEDDGEKFSVSAIFMPANLFDVNYRRAVEAWKKDTSNVSPPRPEEYWLLQLNVSQGDKKIFTNIRRWPGHTAEFSRDKPWGRIGESYFEAEEIFGETVFKVSLNAPDISNRLRLKGELKFTTESPGFAPSGGMYGKMPGGTVHEWQFPLGLPYCVGSLRIERRDGSYEMEEKAIKGRGYVDHMWGSGLLGEALKSWHFGTLDRGVEGRLVFVWLVPESLQTAPYGFSFLINPRFLPRAYLINSLTPLENAAGAMGLDYYSKYRLNLNGNGDMEVALQLPLGEDWPFQVSGASSVQIDIPGVVKEKLEGVSEYLLQSGIDDPDYAMLFDLIDDMEWLE